METILTGIRANSELTLGNFLGALLPMVRLANKHNKDCQINIFVPDLHTIIADIDGDIETNMLKTIKYYIAAGLEITENVHMYRQSYISAHAELCWILNCIATTGELSRMTQFKDKSDGKSSVGVGIFDYPVLMASDILLYSARYVPVGEDQFQHIELTRTLATRFNHRYGEIFVVPEKPEDQIRFMEIDNGIRIRDLQNPEKKMSKSSRSENGKIMMNDSPEAVVKKIMSATTDSIGEIKYDMFNQPGISNLLQIESLLSELPLQDVISTWAGETKYGDLKRKVADTVSSYFSDFQSKVSKISDEEVFSLLKMGESSVSKVASEKLLEVQKAVGLR